jgi:uncharacterized membrane protein
MLKENTIKLKKFEKIILYFFIYAFIGWVLESFYSLYSLGYFTKRGFLFGPICPIYGYGGIILILLLTKYKKNTFKLFIISGIVFSIFEYITSFILDASFATSCWDYSNDFFNLNGRISIFFSFVWGIFAILFLNHIHPFIKKKLNKRLSKIPYTIQKICLYIFTIVFIIDTLLSCSNQFLKFYL